MNNSPGHVPELPRQALVSLGQAQPDQEDLSYSSLIARRVWLGNNTRKLLIDKPGVCGQGPRSLKDSF